MQGVRSWGAQVPPLRDPDDCGYDQVTHGSWVIFGPGLQITKVVVQPNALMCWQLPNDGPLGCIEGAPQVAFLEPCPPTRIGMLDTEAWRFAMDSLLRASNLNSQSPLSDRREKSGRIWKNMVTGNYTYEPQFDVPGTPCETVGPTPIGPIVGQDTLVAIYHSHPIYRGEDIRVVCGNSKLPPYDPDYNGGGSDADWANASFYGTDFKGIDVVVVSPERVHLLKKRTPWHQRPGNPNKWTVTQDRCVKS